jgi:serine/threonine-protein kinase
MPTPSLLQRLKERKLVQWAVAYLAGAWVLFEVSDAVGRRLGWPDNLYRGLLVVLAIGFFITLVLAWYHGEKGRQRVSGPELLMVAALLVVAGVALTLLPGSEVAETGETSIASAVDDERPSIAVLPFENFSTDSTFAYFANGMQEQILSALSDISALRVISRSSVMQYAQDPPASPQIGRELNVGYLVEGSVQVSGGQARLSVQLIDAQRDEHLWSGDFDRELTAENLLQVRGEAGRQIAYQIGVNLTPQEAEDLARVLTDNTEAFLAFIEGREAFVHERQSGLLARDFPSRLLFDRALALDPEFAPARGFLSLTLTYASPRAEMLGRAREEAEKALSLLPGLAEARVALGRTHFLAGEAREALAQFRAAEIENPNLALATLELGLAQRQLGDHEGGFQTLLRAEQTDPRNPVVLRALTRSLVFAHQYDDALRVNARWDSVAAGGSAALVSVWIRLLRGELEVANDEMSALIASGPRAPFAFVPGYPPTVVRRLLTQDQRRDAFRATKEESEAPCRGSLVGFCLRKAIYEEEMGFPETALSYWDSLSMIVEERGRPASSRNELTAWALIHEGLGDKLTAIQAAEALVRLAGARAEGQIGDEFYYGPSTRITLARILAHFDEHDRAIDILEQELPTPSWLSVPMLEVDPIWDPLRDHPRFQALLETYRDDVEQ